MGLASEYHELDDLGGGRYQSTHSLKPIAYYSGGSLARINSTWVQGDDAEPHIVSAARLRVRTAPNGDRRFLPVPTDDDAWFSISAPYIRKAGGGWLKPNLGTFTRSGNVLSASTTNVDTTIWHAGHYVKAGFELKNGWLPLQSNFAFRVGLNGMTRQGGTLLYNREAVCSLRAPVVYDLANVDDRRAIAYDFVQLDGLWYALFTLPDLTGMGRPFVDPTLTLQPAAAAGIDTYLDATNATTNSGTATDLRAGGGTANRYRALIKFTLTGLPTARTTTSVAFTYNLEQTGGTATTGYMARILAGNSGWTEGGATHNTTNGATAWAGSVGCNTSGTDYSSTNLYGAASWPNTVGSNTVSLSVAEFDLMVAANSGWVMACPTANNYRYISSSDNGTAGNRPKLAVNYTLGGRAPFLSTFQGAFG